MQDLFLSKSALSFQLHCIVLYCMLVVARMMMPRMSRPTTKNLMLMHTNYLISEAFGDNLECYDSDDHDIYAGMQNTEETENEYELCNNKKIMMLMKRNNNYKCYILGKV